MTRAASLARLLNSSNQLTVADIVPTGNTSSRTANTAGLIRFNTDYNTLESANGTAWANVGSGSSSSGGSYDANTTSTGLFALPQGTTAQRPAFAANGSLRFNTTLNRFEGYLPLGGWQNILGDNYSVDYLIVAGGGAGSNWHGGGGGAGGVLSGSGLSLSSGTNYPITVGGGGSGGSNPNPNVGSNG